MQRLSVEREPSRPPAVAGAGDTTQSTQTGTGGLCCSDCVIDGVVPDCDVVNLKDYWLEQTNPKEPSTSKSLPVEASSWRADSQHALSSNISAECPWNMAELTDARLSLELVCDFDDEKFINIVSRVVAESTSSSSGKERNVLHRLAEFFHQILRHCEWHSLELDIATIERLLWRFFQCLILTVLCLMIGLIVYVVVHGNHIGDSMTTMDMNSWIGAPDKLTDFYRGKCASLVSQAGSLQSQIEAFNRERGFKQVHFTSRGPRPVWVEAIYYPSGSPNGPRVVVVHGVNGSEVSSSVQVAGYMLRKLNVSALILNLRTVEERKRSPASRKNQFEPFDFLNQSRMVLGAWDYAVRDPEGFLGGRISPDNVGLMGFDFGGFVAQHALAAEPFIPALLLDGIVHNLEALVKANAAALSMGRQELETVLAHQAISRCEANLRRHFEDFSVPRFSKMSSSVRWGLMRSSDDTLIPGSKQREFFLQSLNKSLGRPSVLLDWAPTYGGPVDVSCDERGDIHLTRPRDYFIRMCAYWSEVFSHSLGSASSTLCQAVGAEFA